MLVLEGGTGAVPGIRVREGREVKCGVVISIYRTIFSTQYSFVMHIRGDL